MFAIVCELFSETIRNMFGSCSLRCFVGYTVYVLPKKVTVVPAIPVCI